METDALTASLVQLTNGSAGTIATEQLAESNSVAVDILRLRLVDPVVTKPIGVIVSDREPVLPAVRALLKVVAQAA